MDSLLLENSSLCHGRHRHHRTAHSARSDAIMLADCLHNAAGGLHYGHERIGDARHQLFLNYRSCSQRVNETRDFRYTHDLTVGYVAEMNLSSIHQEMMRTERKEIDRRNHYEFARLRPKCFQDGFGSYTKPARKLSIESGHSFWRLTKVLIGNVHSQFHQQQFHDLRQSIALRSRRRTGNARKDFFWHDFEPALQCGDGAQILFSISISHADFLPFLRYPL